MPEMRHGYVTRMHAEERIEAVLAEVLPDVDYVAFDFTKLTHDQTCRIAGVLVGAALAGMVRYPDFEAEPPREGRP